MDIDNLSLTNILQEEAEFIPLMSKDEEQKLLNEFVEDVIPVLPVRQTVLFPGIVVPITAGRDKSIALLNEAYKGDKIIGVVTQKEGSIQQPTTDDIFKVGTVARILKMLKLPDGNTTVFLQGIRRFRWEEMVQEEPFFKAKIELLEEDIPSEEDEEFSVLMESISEISHKIIQEDPSIPSQASYALKNIESPNLLVNFIAFNMNLGVKDKQDMLTMDSLKNRSMEMLRFLDIEQQKLEIKNNIQSKVRSDLDKQQREYFLHQQIRTIQEELGDNSPVGDIEDLRLKSKRKKWQKAEKEHFEKELKRMQRMNPQAPEYNVQRSYLEFFLELPWGIYSKDKFDLEKAQKILDKAHYGLDDVKDRIIEYLAVLKLKQDMKSPILCLYGPPGVGKTSLGKSIAESLGRKYVRMSLGGLHDESEIRGHRKTYIGAMAGRILQLLKKCGTSNPVFVLDEIDKIGKSAQGDPSSALLEVLDPEQNGSFYDNFLEHGYDLSKIMFIATANSLSTIDSPLLDRMEVVNVSGYTVEEKTEIAKKYLFPKQLEAHGLKKSHLSLGKRELEYIITDYTRESGVRNLEKKLAKVIRHHAKLVATEKEYETKVSKEIISEVLGIPRSRRSYESNKVLGVVTGLAWTRVGGDILFIESTKSKGNGALTITGNLGKVMKESATIALEYIKSNAKKLGIDTEELEKNKFHIHVPEGAVPKDGPSAGITILTSLVSTISKRKVKSRLAMSGEITLRGKVLAVGGIKEKILAAKRAKIKEIILSEENRKDIQEINETYVTGLTFHYVEDMKQVLEIALLSK